MSIKASASQLKASFGKFMKAVRAGKEVVVTDRDQPVARLVPYGRPPSSRNELEVSHSRDPSALPLGQLEVRSIKYRGRNTTALLAEERRSR